METNKKQSQMTEKLKDLLDDLELFQKEKSILEKKLPKGFRRSNPIYQYGRMCAFIEQIEIELEQLKRSK